MRTFGIFLTIVYFFSTVAVYASERIYGVPSAALADVALRSNDALNCGGGFLGHGYDAYELYPIGWSRDGKFAYAVWSGVNYADGPSEDLTVYVQDLVTDKIVREYRHYWAMRDHEEEMMPRDFRDVWNSEYYDLERGLQFFGIVQEGTSLLSFPLQYDRASVVCEILITASEPFDTNAAIFDDGISCPDGAWEDCRRDYDAAVYSSTLGSKIIHSSRDQNITGITVAGYFRSPFEDRIAVVVVEKRRLPVDGRYTGETGTVQIVPVVFGCSLKTGYR